MKHIRGWNNLVIHPFTIVYLFCACAVGKIEVYILTLLLVIFHEMGHYFTARFFQFDIDKVEVLPFGAFLSLNDYGRHPVYQELCVVLAGPVVNLLLMVPLQMLHNPYLIEMNKMIMCFNLVPIYPLDGSKIILLLLSYVMNYQDCFQIQIKISIFTISIAMIFYHHIGSLIVLFYLFYQNVLYIKEYRYVLIQTILDDHENRKKTRINKRLVYYRPYHNIYYYQNQYYDLQQMKFYVIKSIKNH